MGCLEVDDQIPHFMSELYNRFLNSSDPLSLQSGDKVSENLALELKHGAMRAMLKKISLDDLRFGEVIGEGASGLVKEAWYNGCKVAAKLIKASSYEQEARILSPHRNVLNIIGYAKAADEGDVWLIMERMDTDMQQYMEHAEFSFEDSFDAMSQVAQGMKHLHENGVLHRDLKPANVLLDHETQEFKICDFGNSTKFPTQQELEVVDKLWRISETIWSPQLFDSSFKERFEEEQRLQKERSLEKEWMKEWFKKERLEKKRRGEEPSEKLDVHSYGAIYWNLLTGEDQSDGTKHIQVSNIPVSHLESITKCLDQEQLQRLLNLINECLDEDPHKRPTFKFICEEHQSIKASWVSQKRSSYGDHIEMELKAENMDLQNNSYKEDLQNNSYKEVKVASTLQERLCNVYVWLILEIMGINLPKSMQVFPFWNLFDMMKTLARRMRDLNDVYYTTKRGTKAYWAPEMNIEAYEGKYDGMVDVYSYGVIWWQLLTGKRPTDGMKQLRKDDIPPSHLTFLNGCLSEKQSQCLFELINSCLDQDPMNRPSFAIICEELCSIEAKSTFGRNFTSNVIPFKVVQRMIKYGRAMLSWLGLSRRYM